MIAASLLLLGGVASAQQSKTDETLEFRPHWSLNVQGGVAHTRGESEFNSLNSPAAQLSATYRFHHAMGVRFGFGGWQGKGAVLLPEGKFDGYSYQFAQLNADYILDLAGVFGGFNHKRVVSPYLLAGVGAGYGFNNEQAAPHKEMLEYYWDSKLFAPVGRAGLGIDFRLGECVSLGLEGNANILTDKFNSKKAENVDFQFNVLAGLSYCFRNDKKAGKNHKPPISQDIRLKNASLQRSEKTLIIEYDLELDGLVSSCDLDVYLSLNGKTYKKIPHKHIQGDFRNLTSSGHYLIKYDITDRIDKYYGKDISVRLQVRKKVLL